MKILDVGCGEYPTGTTSIDIDPDSKADHILSVYDLRNKFEKDQFDCVHAFEVLEHLSDPGRALDEIRYVLKSGGLLKVTVPNQWCWFYVIRMIFGRETVGRKDHVQAWTGRELANLLERHAFKVKRKGFMTWTRYSFRKRGRAPKVYPIVLLPWLRHRHLYIEARSVDG